jgi:CDP-glucose 4,6-dehydratase
MTRIFVTGGTGFIGSHFIHKTKKSNEIVCLMRDLTASMFKPWLSEALKGITIIQGDLQNVNTLRRIMAEYHVERVFHFAAQAIVSAAIKDPIGTFQTNTMGTVNLLEACRQAEVQEIYVQSTDKIYGERENAEETDPIIGRGPYPASKACEDMIAQAFAETYGLKILITRACNVFGYDLNKRIIPNTIRSCMKGEPPIIYEGENTTRQYIHIQDLIDAIKYLVNKEQKGIFNIGTNDILTQEQVVQKICKFFPITPRLAKREKPLQEIQNQSINWNKIKALGWKPSLTFSQAIELTIQEFQTYGT